MENNCLTNLKPRKIYQNRFFYMMLACFVPWCMLIIFILVIGVCGYIENNINLKMIVVYLLLILFASIPVIVLFLLSIKEKQKFTQLLDEGMLLSGRINQVIDSPLGFIRVKVVFIDKVTGIQYTYNQKLYEMIDVKKMITFIKEDKEIFILAQKNDFHKGYILFEEYIDRHDWSGINDTHKQRWDGSYKAQISEIKQSDKSMRIVTGKLLKKTIKKTMYYSLSAMIRIDADITFFDEDSERVYIFKGSAEVLPAVYWKLETSKYPLYVNVEYDPLDDKRYIVHLDEALEQL